MAKQCDYKKSKAHVSESGVSHSTRNCHNTGNRKYSYEDWDGTVIKCNLCPKHLASAKKFGKRVDKNEQIKIYNIS